MPPRPPEAVVDDHGDVCADRLCELSANAFGTGVRINRQQQRIITFVFSTGVRQIDPGIGHDETETMLDDDQARNFALAGGEDYELCFTVAADALLPPGTAVIGTVGSGEGVRCDVSIGNSGYRHF